MLDKRNNVVDEGRHDANDHDRIGACKTGTGEGGHRDAGDIDFIGEKRLQHGRAGVDRDDFRCDALFLQELSVFDDPDRAVGRAESGPGQAQSFLSRDLRA